MRPAVCRQLRRHTLSSEDDSVEVLDLSHRDFSSLFDDLSTCYPTLAASTSASPAGQLAVMNVGSYLVSVAKSFADLIRADGTTFVLPAMLTEVMRAYYGKGFGFIIAAFWNSKHQHPLGYVHQGQGVYKLTSRM